jgi:hypothetical protein
VTIVKINSASTDYGSTCLSGPKKSHEKKRIFFALLTEYYLFDYHEPLVKQLRADGFLVSTLADSSRTKASLQRKDPSLDIIQLPTIIRWALNRSGNLLARFFLWLLMRAWLVTLRGRFDFAIVPWDYRPVWHSISKSMPSLTPHNTTDFLDVDLKLNRFLLSEAEAKMPTKRFWLLIDKLFGRKLLPRANNRILKFGRHWILDRLMGFQGDNSFQGFTGVDYLTVMGRDIKDNFQFLGVGVGENTTKIIITGSPNYESFKNIQLQFDSNHRVQFRKDLGIGAQTFIFTLFLSPSKFSNIQIDEIRAVVTVLSEKKPSAHFVIKFHPKTRSGDPERVRMALGDVSERTSIVTQFGGDKWNAKLVLASDCLVQKQSTAGYLGMMFRVPILSYNLLSTGYDDEMYELIGGSYHAESEEALALNVDILDTHEGRKRLSEMQANACERFCRDDCSPCELISDTIKQHFSNVSTKKS